jgi:hypothetical protein
MSGLGRYIVDAVVLEHRSPTQLTRDHGISKRWVFELLRRFKEGGYAGLEDVSGSVRVSHGYAVKQAVTSSNRDVSGRTVNRGVDRYVGARSYRSLNGRPHV